MRRDIESSLEYLSQFNISNEALEFVKQYGFNELTKLFVTDRVYDNFSYKYRNWLEQAPSGFVEKIKNDYFYEGDYYDIDILMEELAICDINDLDDAKTCKWRSQAPKAIETLSDIAIKYCQSGYPIKKLYEDYIGEIKEVFECADFI